MPTKAIRQAAASDLASVLALYHEFHEFHVRGMPEWLQVPDQYDDTAAGVRLTSLLRDPQAALFIALERGHLIGLAEVYMQYDIDDPAVVAHQYGYLQSLMVTASARRQGLGRRLLAAAERWSRERGATELRLTCWEFAAGPYRSTRHAATAPSSAPLCVRSHSARWLEP